MQLNKRPRRLRKSDSVRLMLQENRLDVSNLIAPVFVCEGENVKEEIPSMPDYFRYSLDQIKEEVKEIQSLGIKSILLFCKVDSEFKDNTGKESFNPEGLMQKAIKEIKDIAPEIVLMTDVALDPYSKYGHDGIVEKNEIINDETVEILCKMALSHAKAGADFVAPSDMMDGRIGAIRNTLESNNFINTGIMSYSAKFASSFYGPFRDALDSSPGFGDKKNLSNGLFKFKRSN